ncbi:MAG: type II toxin-antitoxin system RelE/ParE family toxin [Zoogloeaceae bacterium]|jgi:plasmid stabilization system protein ParE|nr:type II toxin-antitoxin system RelE/ParE family toxin [Zoogloeaceae bacterium]
MPQVKFAPAALRDLERLRGFLRPKNPAAARRLATRIIKSTQILAHQPRMGRPVEELPDVFREWLIEFGGSGYVARYRYDGGDIVSILAIRHQKEAGF